MTTPSKRRLTPEDLYRFILVGSPQITPDGEAIAFVRTHVDSETKEFRSSIWTVELRGGAPVQFTRGPKFDRNPRWSPDGQMLAFHSDRGGDDQIWLINRFGGEARPLTSMRNGAYQPVWSPDGKRIAFISPVGPQDERERLTKPRSEADKKEEEQKAKDQAKSFNRMLWRSDSSGISTGRRRQIWVVDVPGPDEPLPIPVQVTWGHFDHDQIAWSPDGTQIAFASRRTEDEQGLYNDVHITAAPPSGPQDAAAADRSFAFTTLNNMRGYFGGCTFSPDGKTLAVIGHEDEYANATQSSIYLFTLQTGACRKLDNWDMAIGDTVAADVRTGASGVELAWAPDGNMIFLSVSDRGACGVYGWPVAGGKPKLIAGGQREIYAGTFDRNCEMLAFAAGDMAHVGDLYVLDCREFTERRLTSFNDALFDELLLPEIEEIACKAPDGWDLHGWVVKPIGYQSGTQYPLVLDIHGGPHTCFGHSFFQEFQLFAASGYGVLFINPRGSSSYGQQFINGVRNDYGNRDYLDLMTALDHVIAQGWVDEKRLAVTGGSYGGFMVNWMVTHTDRFAAAAAHRSISNWVSFNGTPDFGPFFNMMQHPVMDPWSSEGIEALWNISPLKYVKNVKTPLILMQSEQDYRCPIEQAEQFFMAIKYYNQAPVELVRHPRSNHDLIRVGPPPVRVDRFHRLLGWFGTYCPPNASKEDMATA